MDESGAKELGKDKNFWYFVVEVKMVAELV